MYIQIEQTPNHNAIKFMVNGLCKQGNLFDYEKLDTSTKPSFVNQLFEIPSIVRVFVTSDFVTITKTEDENFDIIKPDIFQILFEAKINSDTEPEIVNQESHEDLDEISKQIIEILEDRIKPAVAMDGGDISFVSFDSKTGIVYVKMKGSCSGCPSAAVTLQQGIKRTLQHYIPEVFEVAAV
jgi:NFU1 iron-sulfur cluster scaffold homolog, mitochondrial